MAVFRLPTDWEKRKPVNANLSLISLRFRTGKRRFSKAET